MRRKLLQWALAMIAAALPAIPSLAQIPDGYYDSLKGKKGAELKNAIHKIIKTAKVYDYGSGKGKTWWGFWDTDRDENGYYIDRYSAQNEWEKATSQGTSGADMNIEHSFPKSWWGGASNQAYKDLYNLMPCKAKINSTKSNFPMGKVESGDKGNGWTKVGTGSDGKMYWEPADMWKGDFARGYMYMATTYQHFDWTGTQALQILQKGNYPTLQKWAYTLYIQWAKGDMPDKLEIQRNEEVFKIQGNRNPYIDFPNLMEYVWGDSIDYAFDPAKTLKATEYKGGTGGEGGGGTIDPTPNPEKPAVETLMNEDFTKSKGGCTETINRNESGNKNIWMQTPKYGWKASAYTTSTKKNHAADAILSTPEIDLTEYKNATLTINQAVNFVKGKGHEYLSIEALVTNPETGETETSLLDDFVVPQKDSWEFNDYNLDLSQYCGSKLQLCFHYTSDETICCTWEIKKMSVKGTKPVGTGINQTQISTSTDIDFSQPYQVYTIDGKKTSLSNGYKGILIIKQGKNAKKIMK